MAHGRIGEGILKSIGSRTPGWINNIGVSLSGGTFKLVQADGSDFTTTDPGWVTVPSTTAGRLVTLKATDANHKFIDDAGASQIIGEEFGVKTGIAWAQDRPFYLYACNADDTDANLKFFISPDPTKTVSPATANIGYQATPAGTPSDTNAFFLASSDITTSHDVVPCSRIGGIRMRMSSLDDWTVQTIAEASGDGIRRDPYVGKIWTMPTGQRDAISGSYLGHAGTPPTWATPANIIYYYTISLEGEIEIAFSTANAGNCTAGSGDATLLSLPYSPQSTFWNATQFGIASNYSKVAGKQASSAGNAISIWAGSVSGSTKTMAGLEYEGSSGTLTSATFSTTTHDLMLQFKYKAF